MTVPKRNRRLNRPRQSRRSMLDLVFPPSCPLCATELSRDILPPFLCQDCSHQITTDAEELCSRCGRSRRHTLESGSCPACRDEQNRFDQVVCLGPYAGTLSEGIVRMKHAGQQSLTAAMGRVLADRIRETPQMADLDVFVPIPMHWQRRILRGSGASQVLAEAASSHIGLPLSVRTIRCTRRTKKQSTLSPTARKKNVKGAFEMIAGADVRGLHVGLVDDTLTTGATANATSKILKQAGAERVSLITVARAVTHS